MLSKAELDEIIDHTGSVIYMRQYLLARAHKQHLIRERVRQSALKVIEDLRNENDRGGDALGDINV